MMKKPLSTQLMMDFETPENCTYCKKLAPKPAMCSKCNAPICEICRLSVGQTVLCPNCVLKIVAKQTNPKPVSELHIYGNHSIRCEHCKTKYRIESNYDKIRIREDQSVWCEDCCKLEEMMAVTLIVDGHRRVGA